jgi:hypothetical protein
MGWCEEAMMNAVPPSPRRAVDPEIDTAQDFF